MDLKKQEEAEKRAVKKIEGEKKAKWKKAGGSEEAADGCRRSGSRSIKEEMRSRSRSRNRQVGKYIGSVCY